MNDEQLVENITGRICQKLEINLDEKCNIWRLDGDTFYRTSMTPANMASLLVADHKDMDPLTLVISDETEKATSLEVLFGEEAFITAVEQDANKTNQIEAYLIRLIHYLHVGKNDVVRYALPPGSDYVAADNLVAGPYTAIGLAELLVNDPNHLSDTVTIYNDNGNRACFVGHLHMDVENMLDRPAKGLLNHLQTTLRIVTMKKHLYQQFEAEVGPVFMNSLKITRKDGTKAVHPAVEIINSIAHNEQQYDHNYAVEDLETGSKCRLSTLIANAKVAMMDEIWFVTH